VKKNEPKAEDIDSSILKLREQRATTKPIEGRQTVQAGDVISGTLLVQIEGEAEATRPEPLNVQIGQGVLPEDIDKGIVGLEVGGTREIKGTVPDSYRDEGLRGKAARYTVTLASIAEKILPELNDEFVATLGREAKTVQELRSEIEKQLADEAKKTLDNDIQVAVLDALVEKNPFLVPQALVDQEIRSLLVRFGMVNPEKVDVASINVTRFRDGLGEVASKRVKGSIVVDRVVELEKLTATADDFDAWMKRFSEENRLGLEDVQRYFSSKERVAQQMMEISREKGIEFLRSNATVKFTE
jgi:trigger factor